MLWKLNKVNDVTVKLQRPYNQHKILLRMNNYSESERVYYQTGYFLLVIQIIMALYCKSHSQVLFFKLY